MGYNISEVSGNATGGADQWTFTLDLSDTSATTVSGNFNVVSIFTGADLGDATSGYSFSALDNPTYGSLTTNTTDGTFIFTVNRSAVIASGSDQVVSFTITGTSGGNSDDDTIFIEILICVTRGTLIETQTGPVPVEHIKPGDMVLTKDNGPCPVRWIGSRKLTPDELAADPSLLPVRIAPGALGGDLPYRELCVSPQHRIALSNWRAELMFGADEVLVPAKALVNDRSVRIEETQSPVEYFHLLFDQHEIVFTEGAPTESFYPGEYALRELGDAVRVELHKLFPELFAPEDYSKAARPSLRPCEGKLVFEGDDTVDDDDEQGDAGQDDAGQDDAGQMSRRAAS
ncbi:MAG: Hint domain-containing protein [Paracoccaceae bacterium]